jgi:protein kinase A
LGEQPQQQQHIVPIQSNEQANNNNYMYQNQQTASQPPQQQQQQQISSSPQQNANSMQGVVSHAPPPNGLQQHAVQPQQTAQAAPPAVFAQPNAPVNAKADGIKPMADGSWPVMRDVKGTKGKYTIGDFAIGRTLGTGSFGRVHMSQSKHNQRFYAIKVLKKQQVVKMKQIEHTNDERRMLAKVKHPFLVTLWGTFSDAKNLYMVMDFVEGGELFSLLRKSQVSMVVVEGSRISGLTMHNRDSPTQSPSSTLLKSR